MYSDWQIVRAAIIRFFLMCFGFAALVGILMFDVIVLGNNIPELSATEITQEVLLAVASLLFLMLAIYKPNERGFLMLAAGFFCAMLIRELDVLFDMIHHGFWVYPALLVSLGAMFCARSNPGTTLKPLAQFIRTPQFNTISYGIAIVLVFSRIFGMGELWHAVMDEYFVRTVKNVAEEGIELLGYGFIFSGCVSYYMVAVPERKRSRFMAALALR